MAHFRQLTPSAPLLPRASGAVSAGSACAAPCGLISARILSMRTPGGEVIRGRWGRSLSDGSLSESFSSDRVAVLPCCEDRSRTNPVFQSRCYEASKIGIRQELRLLGVSCLCLDEPARVIVLFGMIFDWQR